MNNVKKIGLTALGTALVASSAYAGDLSVTGAASMTFAGEEGQVKNNGWSMADSVTMSGSAEMDNGWTVTASYEVDGDDAGLDSRSIKIDMGDQGTLTFAGHGNSGAVNAVDDMTPTANEEAWAMVTDADGATNGNATVDNNFTYTNALTDTLTLDLTYQPSDASNVEGTVEGGLKYTGVEGLTVGIATGENRTAAAQVDNTAVYAKYAVDAFTIGAQMNESDSSTASADEDFSAWGISYAVSDDMSVSVNAAQIDYENTSKEDQEAMGVSFSYTMGSMTISGSHNEMDNIGGSSSNDRSAYELNLKFAF